LPIANTEDVLDRVEQYLCKNVRKVLTEKIIDNIITTLPK